MSEYYGLETQPRLPPEFLSPEREISLQWQVLRELKEDHGLCVIARILDDAGLLLAPGELEELTAEIRKQASPETWRRIEVHLADIEKRELDRGAFIIALWAELFVEPLSDIWLAAMAQHAYFVEYDDFAFGYLTAQLDRRRELEFHFLRGKKLIESGRTGGQVRASRMESTSESTLKEMRRLVAQGLSVARAATLAHARGKGSSPEANRRLWNRHPKVGT